MAFKGNRHFIEALEESGDLVRVKEETDWDLEAGAFVRYSNEKKGPAILFEKIKDYPVGYSIFGSPLGTYRRLAIALGLKPDVSVREVQAAFEKGIEHPIKPIIVDSGRCKEKIFTGAKADLFRLPSPLIHDGDGGRYIGTWHMLVTKDPDSQWTNWGMYAMMIYNRNHIVGAWRPASDLGKILASKYFSRGKPMPFAAVIGADPLSALASITPFGIGQNEVDYAGGLIGSPLELVKCETNDLLVPAHAEIVLEGEILPNLEEQHGPFGEHPGYRIPADRRPVCCIHAITHRRDPILTMTNPGVMVYDGNVCSSMTASVAHKKHLKEHGIPVTDVDIPAIGGQHMIVVGVKPTTANMAMRIKNILLSRPVWQHKILVVEDDVDVFNLDEVMHAFATKCHPFRGVTASHEYGVTVLSPYLDPFEREARKGASLLLDCTWPTEWSKEKEISPRVSFNEVYPEDVKKTVLRKSKKYKL